MLAWFLVWPAVLAAQATPRDRVVSCEGRVRSQLEASRAGLRDSALDLEGAGGARLRYLGVHHTTDPADAQFDTMRAVWRELRPTAAYYEGTGTGIGATLDSSVARFGEPGLVRFLASRDSIPAYSLEPPRDAEAQYLLGTFSAEQITLFYVTRVITELRDRRHWGSARLDSVLPLQLARFQRIDALRSAIPDVSAYRSAFARWFPGLNPLDAPASWFDPEHTSAETGSRFFNDVNRRSSAFRDVYMYRLLANAWRPGARLFAAVGRSHIPAQAAALRCAMSHDADAARSAGAHDYRRPSSARDSLRSRTLRLVRQRPVEGWPSPYEPAVALGRDALPLLFRMLEADSLHPYWDNVVTLIEMVGDSASFQPLHAFVWDRFRGEVDSKTFDALVNATKDLGLLADRVPGILDYLRAGTDARFWRSLPWHTKYHRGDRLAEQMARMSMLGLGSAGSSAAESILVHLRAAPRYQRYRSQIDGSLERLRKIREAREEAARQHPGTR